MTAADRNTTADAPSDPYLVVLDELIVTEPDDGFSREDVARSIVEMLSAARLLRIPEFMDQSMSAHLRTPDAPTDSDTAARARALLDGSPGPWEYDDTTRTLITDLLAERDAAVARADTLTAAINIQDGIEWSVSLSVLRELTARYPSWAADLSICEGMLRRIEAAANNAAADRGADR